MDTEQMADRKKAYEDKKLAILGDCGSHQIAAGYKHIRACGLMSWVSIVSKTYGNPERLSEEEMEQWGLTNYARRVLLLDARKNALDYLLEEKADYLLLDCNDIRKDIIVADNGAGGSSAVEPLHAITDNSYMGDKFKKLIDTLCKEEECGGGVKTAIELGAAMQEKAAEEICNRILSVYRPEEVILHKHFFADQATDGKRIFNYVRKKSYNNNKVADLLKHMYEFIEEKLSGCHVIGFPEYVLGDRNHKLGYNPLHYHALYYEYGSRALGIILENHRDEKMLLEQLRELYSDRFRMLRMEIETRSRIDSLENRVSNIVQTYAGLQRGEEECLYEKLANITDISEYLDLLYLLRSRLLVLAAVKDTPGENMPADVLRKICGFGFSKYPTKLWYTYNGIVYRGDLICEKVSERAEQAVTSTLDLGGTEIYLASESWRKGNVAKIMIDGVDYAGNQRGINLVVYDVRLRKVVDSVSYDAQDVQSWFKRKPL